MTAAPSIQALMLDLDGVLWRGEQMLPGVDALFQFLEAHHLPYCLASNNATLTIDRVNQRLAKIGVSITEQHLVTSAHAAAGFVGRNYRQPPPVLVVGEDVLIDALRQIGCPIVERSEEARAVVVGMDRGLTWTKLVEAGLAIAAGAAFIGTNPDRTFPTERGLGPGNGAILAALQIATGRPPLIAGKPEAPIFLEAASRLAVPTAAILVVGDRLETDIAGGSRAGMQTALVLTGVTAAADIGRQKAHPDVTFEDLPALLSWLSGVVR
jgi:4-nitrophenyl phosphatase